MDLPDIIKFVVKTFSGSVSGANGEITEVSGAVSIPFGAPEQPAPTVTPASAPDVAVSRNPDYLIPELRDAWLQVKSRYEAQCPGTELFLTCTYRSPAEQQRLYAQGRTTPGKIVTNVNGTTTLGNHNYFPAKAFDCGVKVNGIVSWDDSVFAPLGPICVELGLTWGGSWHFKDIPHVEMKA